MYEIWLVLNIVYEIALSIWPTLLVLLLIWLVLLVVARKRLNSCAIRPAMMLAAVVAVVLFFATPALTKSSFSEMGYWVDWANLLGVAAGFGVAAGVFFLPIAALVCPRCKAKA
ncbi:MAG: hypothetical protein KIG95_14395 [Comamonas sp.]|nr:hypothetical protein [Comamonas sp.]